ncbi:hypothetical protein ASZ84_01547 [Vibrio cholerae]|nr:hypothetical protein ASZ84_01547 [Vibrio cholerae]BAP03407.1 hypothetical protein MS6_1752 [Vibrio cholerae MS6]
MVEAEDRKAIPPFNMVANEPRVMRGSLLGWELLMPLG